MKRAAIAIYARVSTHRQAQGLSVEDQLERLRAEAGRQGYEVTPEHLYRDDGYSGNRLNRPGLDRLRDHAALAEIDVILITAPDRLARKYVHQMLLLEEFEKRGCAVEFLERPMSDDPHDHLLLQIRGAVAEYERSLISDRMRRGRLNKVRAGTLMPWTKLPYGYRSDPDRPRDPAGLRLEPVEAALVGQMFAFYAETGATLYSVAKRLTDAGLPTPTGKPRWNVASLRGILKNPILERAPGTPTAPGSSRPALVRAHSGRWGRATATGTGRPRSGFPSPRPPW